MASQGNSSEEDFRAMEERIASVCDKIHKLVDERKEVLLHRLKNLKNSYERNLEADRAVKQLLEFREAGANLLTSNLLESSKLISLEVIDKQIEDWKQKQTSMKLISNHDLVWDESELRQVLGKVDLILKDPNYSQREAPTHSASKHGHEPGELDTPFYLALVEEKNEVYIADSGNHRIVVHNMDGEFIRQFNKKPIESPRGIAVTSEAVFVTDNLQHALYKFDKQGKVLLEIKKEGSSKREFRNPCGVACKYSHVYVCDFNNNRIQIFDESLKILRCVVNKDFGFPSDILFTKKYFYVLSTVNNAIMHYTTEEQLIRTINLKGQFQPIVEAYFFARDNHKNFLISDKYGDCIKVFSKEGQYENMLGAGKMRYPRGIAVTADSLILHVCESKQGSFQIY